MFEDTNVIDLISLAKNKPFEFADQWHKILIYALSSMDIPIVDEAIAKSTGVLLDCVDKNLDFLEAINQSIEMYKRVVENGDEDLL